MKKNIMDIGERKQRIIIYLSLLSAGIILCLAGYWMERRGQSLAVFTMPCLFHDILHLYCPGCGGTRAFFSILNGNLMKALNYNPFCCYLAVIYLWYLIQEGLWLADKKKKLGISGFRFRIWMVWLGLAIFFGYFFIRNGAYLFLQLDWTGDFLISH